MNRIFYLKGGSAPPGYYRAIPPSPSPATQVLGIPPSAGTKPCDAWFCGRTPSVHGCTRNKVRPARKPEARMRRVEGAAPATPPHYFFCLKQILCAFFLCAACILCVSCAKKTMPAQTFYALGTVCTINLFEDGTQERYAQMGARLYEIHKLFSVSIATSDVAAVNQSAGIAAVPVHDDVLDVTRMALYFAQKTGGAFDPSIGALSVLWGIGSDDARVPAQSEIDAALALVDYRQIDIDEAAKTIFLRHKGMILDLGGIAKGYAADEMVRIAREHGVRRALIDLGGNIYVFGTKPAGDAWRVAVKNPENPTAAPAAILDLGENSVVTSGAYERFFEQDGTRYHHILDTKTGYPAQSGVLSATIVSASSMAADALSTSVFVLGKDKGAALLQAGFAEAGIAAEGLILTGNHNARATSGIRAAVTLQGGYRLE